MGARGRLGVASVSFGSGEGTESFLLDVTVICCIVHM